MLYSFFITEKRLYLAGIPNNVNSEFANGPYDLHYIIFNVIWDFQCTKMVLDFNIFSIFIFFIFFYTNFFSLNFLPKLRELCKFCHKKTLERWF